MYINFLKKIDKDFIKEQIPFIDIILVASAFVLCLLSLFLKDTRTITLLLSFILFSVIWYLYELIELKEIIKFRYDTFREDIFDLPASNEVLKQEYYFKKIESGEWYRKLVLGISDIEQGYLVREPQNTPGLVIFGGMGSGKSSAGKFILTTLLASSSECAALFILDVSDKGAGDYSSLFKYKENVVTALYEKPKMIPILMFLFDELNARSKRFKEMGNCASYEEYETKYRELRAQYLGIYEEILSKKEVPSNHLATLRRIAQFDLLICGHEFNKALIALCDGKITTENLEKAKYTKEFVGIAQIHLVAEEAHAIPNSKEMNFNENYRTEGTIAFMLNQLAKTSRSSGFNLIFISQKYGSGDIPSELKIGLNSTLGLRTKSHADMVGADLPHIEKIRPVIHVGRAATEGGGFVQAPFLTKTTIENILEKYYKPLKGELFARQINDYHRALEGTGSDGMANSMPMNFVALNSDLFSLHTIVRRFMKEVGAQEEFVDLTSLETDLVFSYHGELISVAISEKTRHHSYESKNSKNMATIKIEAESILKTKKIIHFDFGRSGGGGGYDFSGRRPSPGKDTSIPVCTVSIEELAKLGKTIDDKEKLLRTEAGEDRFVAIYSRIPLIEFLENKKEVTKNKESRSSEDIDDLFEDDDDFLNN